MKRLQLPACTFTGDIGSLWLSLKTYPFLLSSLFTINLMIASVCNWSNMSLVIYTVWYMHAKYNPPLLFWTYIQKMRISQPPSKKKINRDKVRLLLRAVPNFCIYRLGVPYVHYYQPNITKFPELRLRPSTYCFWCRTLHI